jgi:hypothetical protein
MIDPLDRVHRPSSFIALGFLAATLLTASCGDVATSPASPSNVESFGMAGGSVSVAAMPETAATIGVKQPRCPLVAPFEVPFVVVVHPSGLQGLVVTQLQMQFTDSSGLAMPSITLPAPLPTTPFGSALEAARGDLRFPVTMRIGCGVGRTGTILVHVATRDGSGRLRSGNVSVTVR